MQDLFVNCSNKRLDIFALSEIRVKENFPEMPGYSFEHARALLIDSLFANPDKIFPMLLVGGRKNKSFKFKVYIKLKTKNKN